MTKAAVKQNKTEEYNAGADSVTFRSRTKKTAPPVPPKPRPGNKIDLKALTLPVQSAQAKQSADKNSAGTKQSRTKPGSVTKEVNKVSFVHLATLVV